MGTQCCSKRTSKPDRENCNTAKEFESMKSMLSSK